MWWLALYAWLVPLWPYLVSALAVGFWLALLRRQLPRKIAFGVLGFIASVITCGAVNFGLGYVIPVDVAGTPPPDPRNLHLRFLIICAVQLPVAFLLVWLVSRKFRAPSVSPA